jgi:hypothetical protein
VSVSSEIERKVVPKETNRLWEIGSDDTYRESHFRLTLGFKGQRTKSHWGGQVFTLLHLSPVGIFYTRGQW